MKRIILLLAVLIPFTVLSTWLAIDTGYTAWIRLCSREPWALQIFVDLLIACVAFTSWMVPDARARGLRAWPYVLAIFTTGSVGILAYLIRRELAQRAPATAPARRGFAPISSPG